MIVIRNRQTDNVRTETYQLEVDGRRVTYIEYINDKNKLIDATLMDTNTGDMIDDAALMEEIQTFVDAIVWTSIS